MAEIRVNPTRMELKKLKTRLTTARRGHKLLKDKRDELMRQFLEIVKEAGELRMTLSDQLADVGQKFSEAAAESDARMLTEALMLPTAGGELHVETNTRMNVTVPRFEYTAAGQTAGLQYGFAFTSDRMDRAVEAVTAAAAALVHMAELEKTALLLCGEIERTRRRVNALEYILIPQYERAIGRIAMKLDENERGNLARLMKVKDMMVQAHLQIRREEE